MTLQDIKQISIRAYLGQMGIKPQRENERRGMYLSPLRQENNASFSVDYEQNVWFDHGIGEGGSIIDLVMRMENCTIAEAIRKLEQGSVIPSFSFRENNPTIKQESATTILNILPISHPKLIEWVSERKVDLELANKYCREIHYQIRGSNYFSVGFKNDKSGYELSSPPEFKGCISPKDITTIRNNRDACLVFEGFWDFLSYLMLKKIEKTKHDVALLNSVANVQKAMNFLQTHKEVNTYLDNDEAGQKATQLIKSVCNSVNDQSELYTKHKDLNDYLRDKPKVKLPVKKKSFGIKR
ncbi:DNA primase [Bacteroidales bacterium Barb6XT]|nr:DNA primase [Bacteroidales bacterium Barb6XT]